MDYESSAHTTEEYSILISELRKEIDSKVIIHNLSLLIPNNCIYSIIGPNGAGKTTLLRLILRLLNSDKGTIRYRHGEDNISAMLENDYFFEVKTGWENIDYFCNFFNNSDYKEMANLYSKRLKIHDALAENVATFSKGMKRKLSLLIVLLKDTPFIILDEPTSGIDPESRVLIRDLLSNLKEQGKTILMTSHDLSEIEKCSDVISIMKEGHILDTFKNNNLDMSLEERFFKVLRQEVIDCYI